MNGAHNSTMHLSYGAAPKRTQRPGRKGGRSGLSGKRRGGGGGEGAGGRGVCVCVSGVLMKRAPKYEAVRRVGDKRG